MFWFLVCSALLGSFVFPCFFASISEFTRWSSVTLKAGETLRCSCSLLLRLCVSGRSCWAPMFFTFRNTQLFSSVLFSSSEAAVIDHCKSMNVLCVGFLLSPGKKKKKQASICVTLVKCNFSKRNKSLTGFKQIVQTQQVPNKNHVW